MKKILFFALLLFFTSQAQENTNQTLDTIKIGEILTLGKPSAQGYQHIRFPKTNFIIKKGGIPNYKTLIGNKVIVTHIEKKQNDVTIITLKKVDGRKFFNTVTVVKANFEKATEEKEIILSK